MWYPDEDEELAYDRIIDIFESQGYYSYVEALQDFFVNLIDENSEPPLNQIAIAAISVDEGVIYLRRGQEENNDKVLSFLIRHELLHSLLEHQERFLKFVAEKHNKDYKNLTPEDMFELLPDLQDQSISYRKLSQPRRDNVSKDFEVSRYYNPEDIEYVREIGALLIDDHPEWENLTFEEINDKIEEQDEELMIRLAPKKYGAFDANGKFIEKTSEENDFSGEIHAEDVTGITLLTAKEYEAVKNDLPSYLDHNYGWLRYDGTNDIPGFEPKDIKNNLAPMIRHRNIELRPINESWYLYPVLIIPNLDLYKQVEPGKIIKLFNLQWYVLPANNVFRYEKIICASYIADIPYNKPMDKNRFKGSIIETELNKWLEEQKKQFARKR